MSARRFTVLIIPEGSDRVRRFAVRRRTLAVLAGAALCLVSLVFLVSLLVLPGFRTGHPEGGELSRLQAQNRNQQKELRRLSASLEELRQEMVVLAQNDAKVRVLARLTRPKDALDGIGGPPGDEAATELSDLQRRIDEIRQAIDLRRESQEEIQGFLNDQRSLLAARPRGWPARGWITSGFGMRDSPFTGRREMHEGLDIAAATGTPVGASADGIVSLAGAAPGYGKLVVVDHGYGYKTYYGHNSRILVKVGQRVARGERIAEVGNTGSSTGPHLHYEVRLNGLPLNPRKYL